MRVRCGIWITVSALTEATEAAGDIHGHHQTVGILKTPEFIVGDALTIPQPITKIQNHHLTSMLHLLQTVMISGQWLKNTGITPLHLLLILSQVKQPTPQAS